MSVGLVFAAINHQTLGRWIFIEEKPLLDAFAEIGVERLRNFDFNGKSNAAIVDQ